MLIVRLTLCGQRLTGVFWGLAHVLGDKLHPTEDLDYDSVAPNGVTAPNPTPTPASKRARKPAELAAEQTHVTVL